MIQDLVLGSASFSLPTRLLEGLRGYYPSLVSQSLRVPPHFLCLGGLADDPLLQGVSVLLGLSFTGVLSWYSTFEKKKKKADSNLCLQTKDY